MCLCFSNLFLTGTIYCTFLPKFKMKKREGIVLRLDIEVRLTGNNFDLNLHFFEQDILQLTNGFTQTIEISSLNALHLRKISYY